MPDLASPLVLIVAASYLGAVGYADVFTCQVRAVRAGRLDQATLQLTVLPADKEKLQFIVSHAAPTEIEITFQPLREGEPRPRAVITGFVDDQRNSWGVVSLREVPVPAP